MPKIYVLGALVYDIIFDVPHWIQPENSVHAKHVTLSPGGKGLNQASAACRLGADVYLIGYVGDDAFGDELLSAMHIEGVHLDYVKKHPTARTSITAIIVDKGIPGFVGAPHASKEVTKADVENALANITADDVLLVDFEVPQTVVQHAFQLARKKGAKTVLNPAPFFTTDSFVLTYLPLVDILIPNKMEASLLTGNKSDDIAELADELMKLGVKQVCMTIGDQGSVFFDGKKQTKQTAFPVKVVDTTGASDAYVGAFCVGLVQGWTIEQTMEFASAASGLACTQHGTMSSMPTLEAVDKLIKQS